MPPRINTLPIAFEIRESNDGMCHGSEAVNRISTRRDAASAHACVGLMERYSHFRFQTSCCLLRLNALHVPIPASSVRYESAIPFLRVSLILMYSSNDTFTLLFYCIHQRGTYSHF
jgi:hypothetical protein